jgi:hypothetical protein
MPAAFFQRSAFLTTALGALLVAVTGTVLKAQAVITWGPSTYISADSDVSTLGSLVWAYSFNGGSSNPVVNGVTFQGTSLGGSDLTFTTASGTDILAGGNWGFGSGSSFYTSLSSGYQSLLNAGMFWSGGGGTDQMTLNNLVGGQGYQVQIWVNDSRGYHTTDFVIGSDGLGNAANIRFNNGSTSLGQYVTASFIATGSTETIYLSPGSDSQPQINAISLDTFTPVPEPSTYACLIVGLAVLGVTSAYKRRPSKL